jgi:hypothetical protein
MEQWLTLQKRGRCRESCQVLMTVTFDVQTFLLDVTEGGQLLLNFSEGLSESCRRWVL